MTYHKIKSIYRTSRSFLADLVFPPRCPFCDNLLPTAALVCPSCEKNHPVILGPICYRCGKLLSKTEKEYCHDCKSRKHIFEEGRALYEYHKIAATLYRFKYGKRPEYARYFAKQLKIQWLSKIESWHAQALVPVPIHYKRKTDRGYNQAQVLAEELGFLLHIPVDNRLIKRVKNTLPQKLLDDMERQKNLEKAFKICQSDVKWKTIIIIDDIYTTGSTIDACAQVLKAAGVEKIYFLTIATGREMD